MSLKVEGHLTSKSSPLALVSCKLSKQFMVQQHLNAHYKNISKVKSSIDNKCPKSWYKHVNVKDQLRKERLIKSARENFVDYNSCAYPYKSSRSEIDEIKATTNDKLYYEPIKPLGPRIYKNDVKSKIAQLRCYNAPKKKIAIRPTTSPKMNVSINPTPFEEPEIKMKQPEESDLRYINFCNDVLNDILKNDIFTNRGINAIFDEHIMRNKYNLKMDQMLRAHDNIKRELEGKVDLSMTGGDGGRKDRQNTYSDVQYTNQYDYDRDYLLRLEKERKNKFDILSSNQSHEYYRAFDETSSKSNYENKLYESYRPVGTREQEDWNSQGFNSNQEYYKPKEIDSTIKSDFHSSYYDQGSFNTSETVNHGNWDSNSNNQEYKSYSPANMNKKNFSDLNKTTTDNDLFKSTRTDNQIEIDSGAHDHSQYGTYEPETFKENRQFHSSVTNDEIHAEKISSSHRLIDYSTAPSALQWSLNSNEDCEPNPNLNESKSRQEQNIDKLCKEIYDVNIEDNEPELIEKNAVLNNTKNTNEIDDNNLNKNVHFANHHEVYSAADSEDRSLTDVTSMHRSESDNSNDNDSTYVESSLDLFKSDLPKEEMDEIRYESDFEN